MKKTVIITGYGNVAKELVKLIQIQSPIIQEKYGLELVVTGIVGSKGMLYQENGLCLQSLLAYGYGSEALLAYAEQHHVRLQDVTLQGDILVECSPTNIENGEPGLGYILKAIGSKMDIVCVSKGALVHSFENIKAEVEKNDCQIKYSGATAAALPTIDIGEYSLAGSTITKIEGILNGTSNFILSSMYENDVTFEQALQIAQGKGIAESNPDLDIKGIDSGCKLLLLANRLLDQNNTLRDVAISGIEQLTKDDVNKAKKEGKQFKLIASACHDKLEVKLDKVTNNHPLYYVNGTNKGIVFETVEMGTICVTGGASHPRGAAAAALKDMINLYR
ncbi:MAG: homoserine dehydrogenase [Bacillus sp. (in: firmicutes)]